jgi:hypothetical protein
MLHVTLKYIVHFTYSIFLHFIILIVFGRECGMIDRSRRESVMYCFQQVNEISDLTKREEFICNVSGYKLLKQEEWCLLGCYAVWLL